MGHKDKEVLPTLSKQAQAQWKIITDIAKVLNISSINGSR